MAKKAARKKAARRVASTKSEAKEICFIICPFGGWHDAYSKEIFYPAVEEAGLQARRADDIYGPSSIVGDIWQFVRRARVVLADLTGRNPNVLYELGLAHAVQRPVVMVTQSMDDIPFDIRALRVIEYDLQAPDWGARHWCPVIAQLNPYNRLRPQEFSRIWCGDDIFSAEALFGQIACGDRSRQNAGCCLAAPSSRSSWPMCRRAPSNGASLDTAGSTRRHVSPAGISISAWRSPSSRTVKACGISKRVCAPCSRSSITSASARASRDRRSRMPTKPATGVSTPTSRTA